MFLQIITAVHRQQRRSLGVHQIALVILGQPHDRLNTRTSILLYRIPHFFSGRTFPSESCRGYLALGVFQIVLMYSSVDMV